jgi:predicted nucleic acid-binding protein
MTEFRTTKRTFKIDASGLIYLAKAGLFDLVASLYDEVIVTDAVYQEVVIQGKAGGYPDAFVIEQAIVEGRVRVQSLGPVARERLARTNFPERLGTGEREIIVEALEQGCLAVLDDLHARAVAAALGVVICGSDTLVLEGLLKGRISVTEYPKLVTRLAAVMGMRADDLAELLWLGRLIQEELAHEHD